jgi:hypothetical protein
MAPFFAAIDTFVEFRQVHSVRDLRFLHGHIDVADLERAWPAPFIALSSVNTKTGQA